MFWIQCEYQGCGKWYHTHCIPMSHEEYERINNNGEEWYCSELCRREHNRAKQQSNSQSSNKKK